MNYTKPEITSLAAASVAIQILFPKVGITHDGTPLYVTVNAYEADE